MTWHIRVLIAVLAAFPALAAAQTVRVVAGEHADFTRVVLRVPHGLVWSVERSGAEHVFAPARELTYDVTNLFDRIPRTRLASVRTEAEGLVLDLACDCPVRAWQDRPGIVVIDISDGAVTPNTAESPALSAPGSPALPTIDTARAARDAGEMLARDHSERPAQGEVATQQSGSQALTGLADDLGRQVAQALGQGLLDASIETAARGAVLRTDGLEAEFPPNLRIVSVTERPHLDARPGQTPDPTCRGSEALDFLLDRDAPDFAQGLSQLGHALFGEFDQASGQGFLDLIQLYLAAGLGAEARSLITNLNETLPGRDMLLGFSDVLEGRMSNSRMRLSEAVGCGGAAAVGAVLAHPEVGNLPEFAASIALSYGRLPATLQAALGTDLVETLIAAGARDEARIVATGLHQSPWALAEDIALAGAILEGGRGEIDRATDRLNPIAMRSIEGTLSWLQLALSEGTIVATSALEDAEALAAENRDAEAGLSIMAAAIRLRTMLPPPDGALVALDRLETWINGQSDARNLVATLRDEIWSELATTSDNQALLALTLARSDWLEPDLSLPTRQILAARLVDLGFSGAAERLLASETDEQSLRQRAVAALRQGAPETAVQLIEADTSIDALQIRAASASHSGRYATAAAMLDAAGNVDAAARAAILGGDWRRVDDLRSRGAEATALVGDASGFLGLPPGIAEITFSRLPANSEGDATQTDDQINTQSTTDLARSVAEQELEPALADALLDPALVFDRMGMISRASLLLAESERLRNSISPTLRIPDPP